MEMQFYYHQNIIFLEVPLMLLPKEIRPGNILKFRVERNLEMERQRE